jgi:hypothetical protein
MAVGIKFEILQEIGVRAQCFRCDSQIQRLIKTAAGIERLVANPDGLDVEGRSLWACCKTRPARGIFSRVFDGRTGRELQVES